MQATIKCHGSQDLHYSYIRQIMPVLAGLNEALTSLKKSSNDEPALIRIGKGADQMSDLAMIHGFDGVQTIAERISQSIRRALQADSEGRKRIRQSVESSLKALHTVLRLEEFLEHRMTVENIGRTVERGERKVRIGTRNALQQLDGDTPDDSVETEPTIVDSENTLVFDINDSETVIHLSEEFAEKNEAVPGNTNSRSAD